MADLEQPGHEDDAAQDQPGQQADDVARPRAGQRASRSAPAPHALGQLADQCPQRVDAVARSSASAGTAPGPTDDDAVGVGRHLGRLGAVDTPRPDAHRQVGDRPGRSTSTAAASPIDGPGPGHAHRGHGVDEAAAWRGHGGDAAASVEVGATRKTRSRPCSSLAAIHSAASSGMRSGVIEAGAAGRGQVAGEGGRRRSAG